MSLPLPPARIRLAALLAAAALAVTGCAGGTDPASGDPAASESGQAALDLPDGWTYVAGEPAAGTAAAQPVLPVTVTDGTGTQVEITDVSRIITAGDGIASTLGALGLSANIYAAPDNSTSPEGVNAPEHFAFSKETGMEGLLAMDGTLFIGDNTARHGEVAQRFRDAGVAAVVVDDQQSQAAKIQAVADYVGVPAAGAALVASLEEAMAQAKQVATDAGLADVRVIQVTATGAGGQNSVAGVGVPGTEMVQELGMVSIGQESGLRGYSREFSNEGILAAQPDVILLAASDYARWGGEQGLWDAFPTLAETPAGQSRTVLVMPDAQLRYSSPELGAGAKAFAEAVAGIR